MFYELLPKFKEKGLQTFLKLWDQMETTLFHNLAHFTHTQRQSQREKKQPKNKQTKNKNKQTDQERNESQKAAQEYRNKSR